MNDSLLGRIVVERLMGADGPYIKLSTADECGDALGLYDALAMLEMAKTIAATAIVVEDDV